jgi:hypothetical protein
MRLSAPMSIAPAAERPNDPVPLWMAQRLRARLTLPATSLFPR